MKTKLIIVPLPFFLIAAVVGLLWAIPYFIHDSLGTGSSVLLGVAVGLFVDAMPTPDGEKAVSWKSYLLNGFLIGITMLVFMAFAIKLVCLVFTSHALCDPRLAFGGLMAAIFFLYYFSFVMTRTLPWW